MEFSINNQLNMKVNIEKSFTQLIPRAQVQQMQ